jgi:hypothetical protein
MVLWKPTKGEGAMKLRVMIEFVVDVPNEAVARDVGTRLIREQHERVREVLESVTGFPPSFTPSQPGFGVALETVTWNDKEKDWVGEDDED